MIRSLLGKRKNLGQIGQTEGNASTKRLQLACLKGGGNSETTLRHKADHIFLGHFILVFLWYPQTHCCRLLPLVMNIIFIYDPKGL